MASVDTAQVLARIARESRALEKAAPGDTALDNTALDNTALESPATAPVCAERAATADGLLRSSRSETEWSPTQRVDRLIRRSLQRSPSRAIVGPSLFSATKIRHLGYVPR